MLAFVREWVVNIVILAIMIVLLELLIPTGKLKKFVNLISGFILIIAVINPILGVLNKGINIKDFELSSSSYIDRKEVEADSEILEDSQMKLVIEVYRNKVIGQLEESAREVPGVADASADVIINEDYKDKSFCQINRVYLVLKLGEKTSGIKPVVKVENVKLKSDKEVKRSSSEVDKKIKDQLAGKVNELFGVAKENIVISLQDS